MKKILWLSLMFTFLVSCGSTKTGLDVLRTINVTGYGSIEVEPDYMTISITISTIDPSPRVSQAQNKKASQETLSLLGKMGVEEKWITTLSYNLSEYTEYNYVSDRYERNGYQTIHNLQVRVIDLNSVPEILSLLIETGISSINSIEYGIDNYIENQNLALQKAVEAARKKAEIMIEGQDVTLGSLISVSASTPYDGGVGGIMVQNLMQEHSAGSSDSSLATGARFVRATISAQFELIQNDL